MLKRASMYKIIAIVVVFALLAVGFSRWKKKSRHTYRPIKAGGKRPQSANFDIARAIEWEGKRNITVAKETPNGDVTITSTNTGGEWIVYPINQFAQ